MVAPNLADIEHRYGFDPAEFRTWVLLHELTHRAQFTGVPWMRDHFTGLVDTSLSFADPDPARSSPRCGAPCATGTTLPRRCATAACSGWSRRPSSEP